MGDHDAHLLPARARPRRRPGGRRARLWDKAQEAFGFVPNVFRAQAVNGEQFLAWWGYFNLLVNKEGHLSNADRELLAVVVSSVNRCTYCEVSHGAALRTLHGDAVTADLVASNWRQAGLAEREAAMARLRREAHPPPRRGHRGRPRAAARGRARRPPGRRARAGRRDVQPHQPRLDARSASCPTRSTTRLARP